MADDRRDPPAPAPREAGIGRVLRFPRVLPEGPRPRVWTEWRGIAIASPATLDPVPPSLRVPIARRWHDGKTPYLRLLHPERGTPVDYAVRWVIAGPPRALALLELAPGWPAEGGAGTVLVDVLDRDGVAAIAPAEFKSALGRLLLDVPVPRPLPEEDLFAVFGAMPEAESPEGRSQAPPDEAGRLACFSCEAPLASDATTACPRCGASPLAPACPKCGNPVSHTRSVRAWYRDENGRYAWHRDWDGRCASCGLELASRTAMTSGHRVFVPPPGTPTPTTIEIRGGESTWTWCDAWDHRPTIEIRVTRPVAANRGPDGSGLGTAASITLTHEEWRWIAEQMQGPLRLLLERPAWDRDTT